MTGFLIKSIKMSTKADTQGNCHVQMETEWSDAFRPIPASKPLEGRQKAEPSDRTNPVSTWILGVWPAEQ